MAAGVDTGGGSTAGVENVIGLVAGVGIAGFGFGMFTGVALTNGRRRRRP